MLAGPGTPPTAELRKGAYDALLRDAVSCAELNALFDRRPKA